jgi:hypothetical protein
MEDNNAITRRSMLAATGSVLGTGLVSTTVTAESDWTAVETPTTETLYDVEYTDDDAFAVGGNGVVLERESGSWQTVVSDGPSGNGKNLAGTGVTDDGERLWFVGASGAVGEYDVSDGLLVDQSDGVTDGSEPDDYTGNFRDVAVTGEEGDANVFITDDSGIVHYSFDNGQTWDYLKPGSGSTIPAIDFYDTMAGHVSDTNQTVIETTDGETWNKVGIDNVDENLYGLDSDGPEDVWVCGNRGMIFSYDGSWSTTTVGDVVLRDIGVLADDSDGYTVGSDGRVFRRQTGGWTEESTPTDEDLKGVVLDTPDSFDPGILNDYFADIAVGANGTVIEHQT